MGELDTGRLLDRARVLAGQGDLGGAVVAYEELIATQDEVQLLQASVELAQLFAAHGQFKSACTAYRAAIPLIRLAEFVQGTVELAEILEAHGDVEGAVGAYQEVVYRVGGVEGATRPSIYVPTLRTRAARVRAAAGLEDVNGIDADGPDVPAVFQREHGEHNRTPFRPSSPKFDADISMMIGCGEVTAAEARLQRRVDLERDRPWLSSAWTFKLLRISDVRGDYPAMRKYLDQYAREKSGLNDGFIDELREGLERTTPPDEARVPLFPWGGENDPLGLTYMTNPQLLDSGVFFRTPARPPQGGVRFVMLGGPVCYLNARGEHSRGEPTSTDDIESEAAISDDSALVHALTEDLEWTALGADLSHQLLGAAQRCGEQAPWAFATGIATRKFQERVKANGHRMPRKLKPGHLVLDKPARGVWLYHPQPATFLLHQHASEAIYSWSGPRPSVAWWRTPDRSDLLLQAWCDTLAAGADQPVTVVLPDTPMLRDFARRYIRQQTMDRIERTYLENAVHFAGFAEPTWEERRTIVCYRRFRTSLLIDTDGAEFDGDLLTAALQYLQIHHEFRISPFAALRDPLLSSLLTANVESHRSNRALNTRWTAKELEAFRTARSWFELYQSTADSSTDLYALHDPRGGQDD